MNPQHFVHPATLFTDQPVGGPRPWACVRTRSRCEKQLAAWFQRRDIPHFLPTVREAKRCVRTRYTVEAVLFPGYVFFVGDLDRSALRDAKCVVDVLRPGAGGVERLERDLWTIWRGLESGSRLELTGKLMPGDVVRVREGAFKGMEGRFEKWGERGWLHVWLDIMGRGVAILLPELDVSRNFG